MSDWNEKLQQPAPSVPGRARATAEQLAAMWGSEPFNVKQPPERIRVKLIDEPSTWRRVAGSGAKALYEREE